MDYKNRSSISSPLHIAIIANNEESLCKLISLNINTNVAYGNEMNTPLIEACKRGYINLIDYLLKANAIVSKPNRIGKTADQYLEEIVDHNRSKLLKDNRLDIFEFYIKKLKKHKMKEELIKLNRELDDLKRKIKENEKKNEIKFKENWNQMTIGFKKII